jgi:transcriptional regulator with GAF, ATPase, and Fis domain
MKSNYKVIITEGLKNYIAQIERSLITESLIETKWVKAVSARNLGLKRPTLLAKMRVLNIPSEKRS